MFRGKARFSKSKKAVDHRANHRARENLREEVDDFSPRASQKSLWEVDQAHRGRHGGRPYVYDLEINDRQCESLGYPKVGPWPFSKDYLTQHKMEDLGAFCPRRDRTRHAKTKNAELCRERDRTEKGKHV